MDLGGGGGGGGGDARTCNTITDQLVCMQVSVFAAAMLPVSITQLLVLIWFLRSLVREGHRLAKCKTSKLEAVSCGVTIMTVEPVTLALGLRWPRRSGSLYGT